MSTGAAPASGPGRESWGPLLQLAAQEVFDTMLGSGLTVPPEPAPEEGLDITAMVGLAGQLCGVITIRCSGNSAEAMAARLLGTEPDQASHEMWDAIGEICNMVAGNFKNKITGLGDGCMLSIPTVITGGNYRLHSVADEAALHTAMAFDGAPVIISLQVHS
ncbi:MAG: chemotaxis protein CheX [Candidatus Sulfotelmatobacter sp.]